MKQLLTLVVVLILTGCGLREQLEYERRAKDEAVLLREAHRNLMKYVCIDNHVYAYVLTFGKDYHLIPIYDRNTHLPKSCNTQQGTK